MSSAESRLLLVFSWNNIPYQYCLYYQTDTEPYKNLSTHSRRGNASTGKHKEVKWCQERKKKKNNKKKTENMKRCMVTNMKNKNRKPTGDTHKSDLNIIVSPPLYISKELGSEELWLIFCSLSCILDHCVDVQMRETSMLGMVEFPLASLIGQSEGLRYISDL